MVTMITDQGQILAQPSPLINNGSGFYVTRSSLSSTVQYEPQVIVWHRTGVGIHFIPAQGYGIY